MKKQNKIIFSSVFVAITLSLIGGIISLDYANHDVETNESVLSTAFSQESTSLSKNNPTIKVTGDASITIEPDQAVMTIARHSQPTDIMTALEEHKQGTQDLINIIRDTVEEDSNSTEITIGRFGLDPYYMGEESYSSIDTFTVRSTTSVETDIDHFSDVVNKLTDEGYTFESVHTSRMFPGAFMSASLDRASSGGIIHDGLAIGPFEEEVEPTEEENEANQITLNVAVSTKPAPIDEAVEAYEQKHQKLLEILTEQIGIQHDKIQPANVNINPLYYGPSNQNSIYNTYSQIFVKTSPDNIEKITTAIQDSDAFVDNIRIVISEDMLEQAQDQLNLDAFANAKDKAQKMAQMVGLEIGGVQNIESITEPMEQRRTFHGGLYQVDPWRYYDSGKIGIAVTVEFELKR